MSEWGLFFWCSKYLRTPSLLSCPISFDWIIFLEKFFHSWHGQRLKLLKSKMVVIALLDKKLIFFFFVFILRFLNILERFYTHDIPFRIVFPKNIKSLSNSKSIKSNTQLKIYCQLNLKRTLGSYNLLRTERI